MTLSWYGNECINTKMLPKDPTLQYPLMMTIGAGCGTLGENPLSLVAGSDTQTNFLKDNDDLMVNPTSKKKILGTGNLLPGYETAMKGHESFKVYLMNRQRILTANTASCDAFRFNTNNNASALLATYDTIYTLIKWLAIVATSTAMIALMMLLLVILAGNRVTQTFMTGLYTVCLIGLFVAVVLVWKARF